MATTTKDKTVIAAVVTGVFGLLTAAVTGGFGLLKQDDSAAEQVDVAGVTLRATATSFNVRCPATFTFSGGIDVAGGSGQVVYRFLRRDGGPDAQFVTGDRQTAAVGGAGTVRVDDAWTPTIPIGQVARTVVLEVVSPTTRRSEPVTISGTCDANLPDAPPIPPPDVGTPPG